MKEPIVGAHVSAAGGLPRAVERGIAVGCRTIQVFTKNSNQWAGKPLDRAEGRAFAKAAGEAGLEPLASHAAYLINLASGDAAMRERSVDALADEIVRCDAAGIPFLVLHPGSHGGEGEEAGIDRIARGLDEAFRRAPRSKASVLLETAAGQGACLGHTLDQLGAIRKRASAKKRIAVCLDTCHIHAAGYDLVSRDGWRRLMDEVERTVGVSLVKVIHANDSKKGIGCRVDRHERIGLGAIGEKGFANLMTEPLFASVPKILETPKSEDGSWDREGLAALRRLAGYEEPSRRSASRKTASAASRRA